MFKSLNVFRLLQEIRDELRLIRNFLARIANVPEEEMNVLTSNFKQDYSKAEYIPPIPEEEILDEEDKDLVESIENKINSAEKKGNTSFYAEDNIADLMDNINEG